MSNEKQIHLDSENAISESSPPFSHHGHVVEKIHQHSHDADEAMKAFEGNEGQVIVIDEATNKRILRRIDWNLIPIMCVVYGLNFLDKTTISYASIMGIKKDLGLVGDDYQWLGSIFCEYSHMTQHSQTLMTSGRFRLYRMVITIFEVLSITDADN